MTKKTFLKQDNGDIMAISTEKNATSRIVFGGELFKELYEKALENGMYAEKIISANLNVKMQVLLYDDGSSKLMFTMYHNGICFCNMVFGEDDTKTIVDMC